MKSKNYLYEENKINNRKIKVLSIISRMNIGGTAIHVHSLISGLDSNKFDTTIVSGTISSQEGDMSYLFKSFKKKILVIPELQREINLKNDIITFIKILKILYRKKPDIVNTHASKAGLSTRIAVFFYNFIKKKICTVHTFHGHIFEGYFGKIKSMLFINIERLMAKCTDNIIALSESQQKRLVEKFKIGSLEKVKHIKLGFNLKPFLNSNLLKGQFRKHLQIDNDTMLIGIVGRLVYIKNHIMFIDAAKIFLANHPEVKVNFVIVGDGDMRCGLEKYCKYNKLEKHIIFSGWIKNMSVVYADLDLLALTSTNEGTPVSIIEAMAASVAIIATDVGGVHDLLGYAHEKVKYPYDFTVCDRGILCKTNDPSQFADGLTYIAEEDNHIKNIRLNKAYDYVKKTYSQERLVNDMQSLYLKLYHNNI